MFVDSEALVNRLDRAPPDGVMIGLPSSGERLEITVSEDGGTQFMRFTGDDVAAASAPVANLMPMIAGSKVIRPPRPT